jgi:outer membrane protein assembly factor BamB
MKFSNLVRTLFLLASAGSAAAQPEGFVYADLLEAPTKLWSAQLFPDVDLGSVEIEAGNGIVMAPDGKHALVTTVGATVYAFDAYTGEQAWVYQPEAISNSIARSHSAVIFGPQADYMVYSVVDNENSMSPTS